MAWVDPEAGTTRLTMLFSAKEAVFKALFPIEGAGIRLVPIFSMPSTLVSLPI